MLHQLRHSALGTTSSIHPRRAQIRCAGALGLCLSVWLGAGLAVIPAFGGSEPATKIPHAPTTPTTTPPTTTPTTNTPAKAVEPAPKAAAFVPQSKSEQWWIDRNETFNARAKQGAAKGDIGIVFLGDSITQGWEKEGKEVWEKQFARRGAVNFGIGGDRTEHLAWRVDHGNLDGLAAPKEGAAPKLAIVMIGTNNSGKESAETIGNGVKEVVTRVRAKLPSTKVLLLGIFPRSEKPGELRTKVAEASAIASSVADGAMIEYLDIGAKFVKADGSIDKAIMPDFLHLSPAAYQIWADAIEPAVKKAVGE